MHSKVFKTCETPPGAWHPALGSSKQQRQGPVTVGPEGENEKDQDGEPLLQRQSCGWSVWTKEGFGQISCGLSEP